MIGLGLGEKKKEVLKAYEKLKSEGIEVQLFDNYKELIDSLLNKEISGAVRGSLPSKTVLYLREKIGKFYRASILKNPFYKDEIFLLSPVGIDEISENKEERIKDKINIVKYSSNFLNSLNITPKIGLLSGGRLDDLGRGKVIDKTILEAERIKNEIKDLNIVHKGILIEEYLREKCNVIIAIDGITGNLIFRCLALIFNLEGYGAIILNKKVNFIDTSRNGNWKRYYNAVKFLCKGLK
ncbi:methanogenesis marker protein Mmp4/MtxX [Methanocaldococcus indicus]|uniref:methanogenesis marker protein Mmp4/MtxX n=1 Tax=Methanocaldococcus indicus TaxID=213231 RepID=UPI003C6D9B49